MSVELIGVSSNITKIREIIDKVAHTGINLVVCGETGVGKEVVVRQLYQRSSRCRKPFVAVNCAALPDTLLESEMFGYERGAFTGAQRRTRGKFEQADGGVLFLDEIGDMSLSLQSKLLYSLQDGWFHRLGSEEAVKTDAWVIAATNHNLQADVEAGRFTQDLCHRISAVTIHVEPLRNRPEDIPLLINHYCERYKTQIKGRPYRPLGNAGIDKLIRYHWPGNVRELQNALKCLIIVGESEAAVDDMIASAKISDTVAAEENSSESHRSWVEYFGIDQSGLDGFAKVSFKQLREKAVDIKEKHVISSVLKKTGWSRSTTSRIWGVSHKSLLAKVKHLKIRPPTDGS